MNGHVKAVADRDVGDDATRGAPLVTNQTGTSLSRTSWITWISLQPSTRHVFQFARVLSLAAHESPAGRAQTARPSSPPYLTEILWQNEKISTVGRVLVGVQPRQFAAVCAEPTT